jgi:3-isopropylmalate dehydrogenase
MEGKGEPMAYKIAVMPGDGTGPEVIREGVKVLKAVAEKEKFKLDLRSYDLGADRYLKTGEVCPDSVVEELKKVDAIYLGALGHPQVPAGVLERGIILKLRFALDQYINLRPVKLFPGVDTPLKDKGPEHINYDIIRENTEGLYIGAGGFLKKGTLDEVAIQESINTRKGVERCIRYGFKLCLQRNRKKKLTMAAKTNVMNYASDLWMRTFEEVAKDYPQVQTDYSHVDALCMWLVKNPESFDVIVTDNLFGDIITDLAAITQGGLGIAAGGNINPDPGGVSMFEPMGGSAPKYTGQNVINPLAAIGAGQMMLAHLGEKKAAERVEKAIAQVTRKHLKSLAAGKMGYTTEQVGDLVVKYL